MGFTKGNNAISVKNRSSEVLDAEEKPSQKALLSICRKQRDLIVTGGQELLLYIGWVPWLSKVNEWGFSLNNEKNE